MYSQPANSPFVPNVEKKILTDKINQDKIRKERVLEKHRQRVIDNKLVDLQVYEPSRPKPKPQGPYIDPQKFVPITTQNPYFPAQFAQQGMPVFPYQFYHTPNQNTNAPMPLVKNYSINASGPAADHSKLSMIYEDVLPNTQFGGTSLTISERTGMLNFVRSVMIKHHDGEDISLEDGDNSLLSYLKLLELNPYSEQSISNNPYKGLPKGMLVYRSCYPIRYDEDTGGVKCAKDSLGMNVRIYKMTQEELSVNRNRGTNQKYYDFNLWREIAYYEYVREEIVKRKVSPNFVMMYSYYISEKSGIDFDKLELIKGKEEKGEAAYIRAGDSTSTLPINRRSASTQTGGKQKGGDLSNAFFPHRIEAGHDDPTALPGQMSLNSIIERNSRNDRPQNYRLSSFDPTKEDDKEIMVPNPKHHDGHALVALTEAPTHSLFSWTSNMYVVEGNVRRMTYTGFYNDKVWRSVLFQLMSAMYVMQIHNIHIQNFDLGNNVYIKDLKYNSTTTDHWCYKVDGMNYYVPNYGHLVMIDSNYRDLYSSDATLLNRANPPRYKIMSNIYQEGGGRDEEIRDACFDNVRSIMRPDAFTGWFETKGGNKPPEDTLALMKSIYDDISRPDAVKDIGHYIHKYFRTYLNNRIGTYLTEPELEFVLRNDVSPLRHGEIVVAEVAADTYKFVCVIDPPTRDRTVARVLSKRHHEDTAIQEMEMPAAQLRHFSSHEPVKQDYKPNEGSLNEADLLETYTINNE